jgi:hypothetical protein
MRIQVAPNKASSLAIAKPMPCVLPHTNAFLPSSDKFMIFNLLRIQKKEGPHEPSFFKFQTQK